MSKTDDDITMQTLKSLDRCAQLSLSMTAKEWLGSKNQPLLRIEHDHVIPDELHLLLRVTDVLIRNIVWEMVQCDQRARVRGEEGEHLQRFQQTVQACGVIFKVHVGQVGNLLPHWNSLLLILAIITSSNQYSHQYSFSFRYGRQEHQTGNHLVNMNGCHWWETTRRSSLHVCLLSCTQSSCQTLPTQFLNCGQ